MTSARPAEQSICAWYATRNSCVGVALKFSDLILTALQLNNTKIIYGESSILNLVLFDKRICRAFFSTIAMVLSGVLVTSKNQAFAANLAEPELPFCMMSQPDVGAPINTIRDHMKLKDTSAMKHKWLDIVYGEESSTQKLDIYLPNEGTGPFPVIISIHGGAFKFGDKADGQLNPALEGIERGYAVVSVNYRMSGEAIFPAATQDIQAAIRFIKSNAKKYLIDGDRIATWGGSAGGNLAAWAGAAGRYDDVQVLAVVDWFGPINFLTMDDEFRASGLGCPDHSAASSPESLYLGKLITKVPDLVKSANPVSYLTKNSPAFFIQHGSKDPMVPIQQSIYLADAVKRLAGADRVVFEVIEGAGHGGPAFESQENLRKVFAFLDKYLKAQ